MISVIVPVYNGGAFLEACLASIAAQTGVPLEILVIDDGSTDETPAICRRWADRDSHIRLFHQKNAGVSAARNHGLREAKGEYLTFVDADDLLPPAALENLRKAAEDGADFVIGSHTAFRGSRERTVIRSQTDPIDALMSMMCGKLYRRSLVEENGIRFREGLPYGEDTVFNLQYAKCAPNRAVLPQVVYRCRMGGSASALRYYPDRDEIAITLLEAYSAYYGGAANVPERILQNELRETVLHYLVHSSPAEAGKRAQKLAGRFSVSGENIVRSVFFRQWKRILLKRIRKAWKKNI